MSTLTRQTYTTAPTSVSISSSSPDEHDLKARVLLAGMKGGSQEPQRSSTVGLLPLETEAKGDEHDNILDAGLAKISSISLSSPLPLGGDHHQRPPATTTTFTQLHPQGTAVALLITTVTEPSTAVSRTHSDLAPAKRSEMESITVKQKVLGWDGRTCACAYPARAVSGGGGGGGVGRGRLSPIESESKREGMGSESGGTPSPSSPDPEARCTPHASDWDASAVKSGDGDSDSDISFRSSPSPKPELEPPSLSSSDLIAYLESMSVYILPVTRDEMTGMIDTRVGVELDLWSARAE